MGWHFINTGLRRGIFNMQYDEYLAMRLLEGRGAPTVRVYGWQPHAISLGFHQDEQDIDAGRCKQDGIDVVRRPTGGRAILHAHELTYSVVMFSGGRSIMDIHARISRALVQSLRYLGVAATLSRTAARLRDVYASDAGAACFASASRYEVQVDGKKIAGSAQRRYEASSGESVVLQHGSILLGTQHRMLGRYVRTRRPDAVRSVLEQRTTDVETILGRPVSFEETAEAARKGFEEDMGVRFVQSAEGPEHVETDSEEFLTTIAEDGER